LVTHDISFILFIAVAPG